MKPRAQTPRGIPRLTEIGVILDRSKNITSARTQIPKDATLLLLNINSPIRFRTISVSMRADANDGDSGLRGYDRTLIQDELTRTTVLTDSLSQSVAIHALGFGQYIWEVRAKDRVNNMTVRTAAFMRVAMVKTYALGGQRVAVRSDGEVNWLHSDHLSSVGATTDRNGKVVVRSSQIVRTRRGKNKKSATGTTDSTGSP